MQSPWGTVQEQTKIAEGIFWVSTSSHGGFMLNKEAMKRLNPALKLASVYGGSQGEYTCFEEDCEATAVIYEMQEAGIEAKGFKLVTKEDVLAYLGHGDTYRTYLKAKGLI